MLYISNAYYVGRNDTTLQISLVTNLLRTAAKLQKVFNIWSHTQKILDEYIVLRGQYFFNFVKICRKSKFLF